MTRPGRRFLGFRGGALRSGPDGAGRILLRCTGRCTCRGAAVGAACGFEAVRLRGSKLGGFFGAYEGGAWRRSGEGFCARWFAFGSLFRLACAERYCDAESERYCAAESGRTDLHGCFCPRLGTAFASALDGRRRLEPGGMLGGMLGGLSLAIDTTTILSSTRRSATGYRVAVFIGFLRHRVSVFIGFGRLVLEHNLVST